MRSLGIDLGGYTKDTTGYALIDGDSVPRLGCFGVLGVGARPIDGESALMGLIDSMEADVVAVDAPLTLPPCLTCPSRCRGPDEELCELDVAREMWKDGANPVSQRPCEIKAKHSIPGLKPIHTMQMGIPTARAVALRRKLAHRGIATVTHRRQLLEVYPDATLARLDLRDKRLGPKKRGEDKSRLPLQDRRCSLPAPRLPPRHQDRVADHRQAGSRADCRRCECWSRAGCGDRRLHRLARPRPATAAAGGLQPGLGLDLVPTLTRRSRPDLRLCMHTRTAGRLTPV